MTLLHNQWNDTYLTEKVTELAKVLQVTERFSPNTMRCKQISATRIKTITVYALFFYYGNMSGVKKDPKSRMFVYFWSQFG